MIPDSMNPRQMSENILELQRQIKEAGSELPTPGVGDTGKILKVGASGYELGNELVPTPTVSDENKIIKVNSEGAYALATEYSYTPPAYSTTEVNTGQKWIDEKDIYFRVLTGDFDEIASATSINTGVFADSLIRAGGCCVTSDDLHFPVGTYRSANNVNSVNIDSGEIVLRVGTTFSLGSYYVILEYTKPDPEPEPSPTPDVTPSPDDDTRSVEEPIDEPIEEVKTTRKRSTSSK